MFSFSNSEAFFSMFNGSIKMKLLLNSISNVFCINIYRNIAIL